MISIESIKKTLGDHPFFFVLSASVTLVSATFFATKNYLQDRFDYKIEKYKDDFASIGRRYTSSTFIDIGRIKVDKDSIASINANGIYHAKDNFYSSRNEYWLYKYTSPIEITLIKNGMPVPDAVRNNPVDLPIHVWLGKETYLVTDKRWDRLDRPELDTTSAISAEVDDTVILFHSDPKLFQPTIILSCLQRSKNSFSIRDYYNLKSKKYSIDFTDISKDEILGQYLAKYMRDLYLKNIPVNSISRKVLSIRKENDILYSSFLVEYDSLEVNKVKYDKFFVWKEFIIYCTDSKVYTIEIELPSEQPRRRGEGFEQVNLWFKDFGIVGQ
jgi:hypothetical protein